MAENNNQATETDIFQQQSKTIETLMDVLDKQGSQPPQVIYAQPAAEPKKAPNYLIYIAAAAAVIFFLKK